MRSKLVVTTEVYMRTRTFMEGVQQATVPPLGPLDLSLARDSLFGQFLATYPQPELDWLTCRSVGWLGSCLAKGGCTKGGAMALPSPTPFAFLAPQPQHLSLPCSRPGPHHSALRLHLPHAHPQRTRCPPDHRFEEEAAVRKEEVHRSAPVPSAAAAPAVPAAASAATPPRGAPPSAPPPPLLVLEVNAPLADLLVACNAEALQRAQLLAASDQQLAGLVRRLFHGEVRG